MSVPRELVFPPLNKHPLGLLDLFGIKRGTYPQRLLSDLLPQIDLLRYYVQANAQQVIFGHVGVIAAVGGPALVPLTTAVPASFAPFISGVGDISVPSDEIWLLTRCVAAANLIDPTTNFAGCAVVCISDRGFGGQVRITEAMSGVTSTAGLGMGASRLMKEPLAVIRGNSDLRLITEGHSGAGGASFTMQLELLRVKA